LNENIKTILFIGLDKIAEPLKQTCMLKIKANSVKQEFEKMEELKRSAMRAVVNLQTISDSGKLRYFG